MNDQRVTTSSNNGSVFWALSLLTGFFILIELSIFVQYFHSFFYQFAFVSKGLAIPLSIIPDIVLFIFAQLGLHIFFLLYTYYLSISFFKLFPKLKSHDLLLAISIWVASIMTVLVANQVFYPNTRLSLVPSAFIPPAFAQFLLIILSVISAALLLVAIISLIKSVYKKPFIYIPIVIILASYGYLLTNKSTPFPVQDGATISKPNIIIIGMDSLRPDFLGYFGSSVPTPFLDSFLQQSSVFSDAVTPLARTFPSWMSILSGIHPKISGIRSNLAKDNYSHNKQSIQGILKSLGYDTMYATDESRFNNIDTAYGFDKSITPRIGLNDFIIGSINDFPFSNLILNTRLGAWLFPYSYANRPSYFNYDPNSFLRLLQQNIDPHRKKPVFLAVHFCLPHHPYLWADLNTRAITPREWYSSGIARVDTQIKDFFSILERNQLLKHSIVIVLSDHGEALEMDGDRITDKDLFTTRNQIKTIPHFYPAASQEEQVNQSGGHGTDVLGLPQYHTLLAFRLYGLGSQQIGIIPGVVSLMDIKSTLIDLANLKHKIKSALLKSNGESLASIIKGTAEQVPSRHIMIESDFSPEALRTAYPDMNKVVLEGLHIFEINPVTTRLTVKPEMQKMIIKSKQFADIYNHWILALYPSTHKQHTAILVNLMTGEWTNDFQSPLAKASPMQTMYKKLQLFYANDLHRA